MIICVIDLKLLLLMVFLLSNLMFSLVFLEAQSLALFYLLNGLSSVPLLSSAKLTMYADDILRSHPFDSLSELCLILTQFLPGSLPTILLLTLPKPNTCSSLSNPHLAFPSLYLNDSPLELVSSYGVFLSSNLSWLLHIRQIRSKLIGFLFCYFYRFSSPTVLFKLYPFSYSSSSRILFLSLGHFVFYSYFFS